jgi:hypothetical protein
LKIINAIVKFKIIARKLPDTPPQKKKKKNTKLEFVVNFICLLRDKTFVSFLFVWLAWTNINIISKNLLFIPVRVSEQKVHRFMGS